MKDPENGGVITRVSSFVLGPVEVWEIWQFPPEKIHLQADCWLVWDLCLLKRNEQHTSFKVHRDFIEKAHIYFPQQNDFLALPGNNFLQKNYVLLLLVTTGNSVTSHYWASLVVRLVKNPLAMWETWVRSLGWEDPLEKGKATHSSILAWRIPWTV